MRTVQSVLDRHADRHIVTPETLLGDGSKGVYRLKLDRAMRAAKELGIAIAELTSWLHLPAQPPAVLTNRPRGEEKYCAGRGLRTLLTQRPTGSRRRTKPLKSKP